MVNTAPPVARATEYLLFFDNAHLYARTDGAVFSDKSPSVTGYSGLYCYIKSLLLVQTLHLSRAAHHIIPNVTPVLESWARQGACQKHLVANEPPGTPSQLQLALIPLTS